MHAIRPTIGGTRLACVFASRAASAPAEPDADELQAGLLEDTLVWWGGEFGRNFRLTDVAGQVVREIIG